MEIGNTIAFGNAQWRVLEIRKDRMLLLTEEIIEQRDYHDRKEEVTWEHSEVRAYLNGEFSERFKPAEQERIVTVMNRNPDNPWYATPGGNDTMDRIFLLSLDEVVRLYFGDSSRLLDQPKPNQRYWFDRKDANNPKRMANFMGFPWWWWTRTPGKNNRVAVYIHGDGNIGIQGNGISKTSFNTIQHITNSNKGGLRPALWVKI